MEEYPKKSYKGFIIWLILFSVGAGVIPFIIKWCVPDATTGLMVRVIDFACCVGVEILIYMIYKNGRIYWYNQYSYEQAKAMSEDERREIAWRPVVFFLKITLVCAVLFIVAQMLSLPWWLDFTAFIIIFIVGAFKM